MSKRVAHNRWLRLLRTSAHLAILAIWFIALAAYVPDMLELTLFQPGLGSEAVLPTPSVTPTGEVPFSAVVVAAFGGLFILFLVFYVIRKIYVPATDKAVERITETAQRQILITLEKRHHKLPKAKERRIGRYTLQVAYLALIVLPLLVVFVGKPIQTEAIRVLVEFISSILALYATIVLAGVNWLIYRN